MIAASGTGYGGGWDDKPTAGAGVASSSNLGYSGEKPGFSRSNSAREYRFLLAMDLGESRRGNGKLTRRWSAIHSLRTRPPGSLPFLRPTDVSTTSFPLVFGTFYTGLGTCVFLRSAVGSDDDARHGRTGAKPIQTRFARSATGRDGGFRTGTFLVPARSVARRFCGRFCIGVEEQYAHRQGWYGGRIQLGSEGRGGHARIVWRCG